MLHRPPAYLRCYRSCPKPCRLWRPGRQRFTLQKLDSNNPGGSKDPNGNDGSGGDKPSDGSGGDNNSGGENPSTGTTDPIPNCPASTTVFSNTRLGNTHNSADYDLNGYSAAADNGSIAGARVFTLQQSFTPKYRNDSTKIYHGD